ncbi:MAG: hypothetical protein HYV38_00920, partial [Candidatus Levybacteria bacterium]|nr:hypothetical protein [Candidatus Levybacteria bacterium]
MPGSETGGPKGPERITRPKVERRRAAPGPAAAARLEGGLRTPGATLGSLASERTPQTTHTRRGPASTPPPPVSTPDVRPVTPPPAPQPGIEGLRDIDDVGNLRPQVAPIPNSVGDFRRQAPEMDRGAPGATVGRPTAENRGRDSRGQGLRQDQGPLDLSEPTRRPEDTVSNSPKKEPEQPPAGSKTPDTAPSGTDQRLKTPEFTPQEQERIQKEVERRLKEEKYKNATPEELKLMSLENKIQAGIATEDDLKE